MGGDLAVDLPEGAVGGEDTIAEELRDGREGMEEGS